MSLPEPTSDRIENFLSACVRNHYAIPEDRLALLRWYVDLLLYHNKALNLISRKDEENIWTHHVLHCTGLLFYRRFRKESTVLDLGTGGGLPGIVFAILEPSLHLTLLDATKKKMEAVDSIVAKLGLTNVATVWGRAEEIGRRDAYAGKFDYVVARAVAPLAKLVKWSLPFLKLHPEASAPSPNELPPKSIIAFKGGDIERELVSIGSLKSKVETSVLVIDPSEEKKVVVIHFR